MIEQPNERNVATHISTTYRHRRFVKNCANCRHGSEDPDMELKGLFCFMDGASVDSSVVCGDWKIGL